MRNWKKMLCGNHKWSSPLWSFCMQLITWLALRSLLLASYQFMLAHLGTSGYHSSWLRDSSWHPTEMAVICQLSAVKYSSFLSELKLHLTVGSHWFAKHCSIPSCMFQVVKEHTSQHPKEIFSENDIKWYHGDVKWLKSVSDPVLIYNYHLFFFHTTYTVCGEYAPWAMWQVNLAK